jgi:hypothetical protein
LTSPTRRRVVRNDAKVRSVQKFFTHRSVLTLDRVPFQLTGELFLYRTHLKLAGNNNNLSGRWTSRASVVAARGVRGMAPTMTAALLARATALLALLAPAAAIEPKRRVPRAVSRRPAKISSSSHHSKGVSSRQI